jgi:methyl-CpG-binding domain protein 4
MIPHRSPYGLIQEDLFPDEWKCLVACLMLNCTSRKQIEKVIPDFFKKWPDPESFLLAKQEEVTGLISNLGFQNRRTKRLFEMTRTYVDKNWSHVSELPGIGEYASRAWEIFFQGKIGEDPPNDGALVLYWKWRKKHDY